MAGLTRKTAIAFGLQGSTSNFGQFGSKQAGSPQTSQDPAIIQQLAAWGDGWTSAVVSGDKAAYIEDMNGFCLVDSYQITYLFQMGIPEWDANTLYFTGSVVQGAAGGASAGQWFVSLQGGAPGSGAGQTNNTPPAGASNAFWKWINPPVTADGGLSVNAIPKASTSGPATLVNSAISDNGTNVVLAEPLKFPDGTVQSSAAVSQNVSAQNVVTGSRALNATFHNSGTKPLFVLVSLGGSNSGGTFFNATALTDSNTTPTTTVGFWAASGNGYGYGAAFMIVLPGNYYRVNSTAGTMSCWTEWS